MCQQFLHRVESAAKLKVAGNFIAVRDRQLRIMHGFPIPFQAQPRRGFIQRTGNTGNARMATLDQIASRHIAAQQRVILNQVAIAVERRPVHHHGRNRRIALHNFQRWLMRFGAQQQQPVDALLHQRFQVAVHPLFVAFGIA